MVAKEERELLRLHQQGNSVKRISLILKRSTGAIESKLRKLGCPLYYENNSGDFHENDSRCCSRDLRRYSDET